MPVVPSFSIPFRSTPVKQRLVTILSLLLGLALFVGTIYFSGPGRILMATKQAGLAGVLSFLGLIVVQILCFTLGWQALLRGAGFQPPVTWTGICQVMGYTGNNLTPSMYLGGEPVAAYFLARKFDYSTRRVMGTMITSKFLQLFAFLIVFFTGSYFVLTRPGFIEGIPDEMLWIITVMKWADIVAALGSVGLLMLVFTGKNVLTGFLRLLARMHIFSYTLLRWKPKIRGMEETIYHAFQKSWKGTILCFVYSFGAMIAIYLRPIVFFDFVSANEPAFSSSNLQVALVNAAVFFTLSQVIQMFQFTPGGLGIFDAASVIIFYNVFGIYEQFGMGFNLVYRIADFVVVATGAVLMVKLGAVMFLQQESDVATTERSTEQTEVSV